MAGSPKRTGPQDALNLRRGIAFYLAGNDYQAVAELCGVKYDTVRHWASSELWKAEVQKTADQHLEDARSRSKVLASTALQALLEVASDRTAKKADRTAAAKELARIAGLRPPEVQLHTFDGSDADLVKALATALAELDKKPDDGSKPG